MSDKFQNKYRISSARAQWWDYGWNGAYFITICTRSGEHFFGEIINQEMKLSSLGAIADVLWHEIPHHAKHVELGDFVVMPNHIHGILIIDKPVAGNKLQRSGKSNVETGRTVETGHALSLQHKQQPVKPTQQQNPGKYRFQNIGKNTVSSIIGSYKSAVTKHANRLGLPHDWQDLFYDHIIRNNAEYQRISDYIVNNPLNWDKDKFNPNK